MPIAKPTLGYPSRTAAVLALQQQGMCDQVIANNIGITKSTVSALANSGQRRSLHPAKTKKRKRRPAEQNARTVVIENVVLFRLHPHAKLRGISVNELVRRLVETAVDDNLVDSILDDMEAQCNG